MRKFFKHIKPDVIVCFSYGMNKDEKPDWCLQSRISKATSIHKKLPDIPLILSGGKGYRIKNQKKFDAEIMLEYMNKKYKNLNKDRILLETKSLNTIHQLVIIKTDFLIPNHWKKVVLVSDELHIKRIKILAQGIFGKEYSIFPVSARLNISGIYMKVIKEYVKKISKKTNILLNLFLTEIMKNIYI